MLAPLTYIHVGDARWLLRPTGYGNYQNKGEAEAILNVLPQLLRREETQVREMGWVQQRL